MVDFIKNLQERTRLPSEPKPRHRQLSLHNSPLLTVGELFANRQARWGFEPSFDGQWLAWWGTKFGKIAVFLGEAAADGREEQKSRSALSGIQHFSWSAYQRRLHVIRGNRLWQVDPNSPKPKNWIDITPRGFQHWNIVAESKHDAEFQVIACLDRNPAAPDLYTCRPDGSGKTLLEQNSGMTLSWLFDSNNIPVVRLDRAGDGSSLYYHRRSTEEPWREFARVLPDEIFSLWLAQNSEKIQGLSNRGRERTALVSIDLNDGSEEVIFEHDRVDVTSVCRLSRGSGVDLLTVRDGYPAHFGLTERGKVFADLLSTFGKAVDFEPLGFSEDARFATVAISRNCRPFDTYLFDCQSMAVRILSTNPLNKTGKAFADTKPVQFTARDGLIIPALLTLPPKTSTKGLPAIVLLHGGPADHDIRRFDRDKQFLSSRGYVVLSVNYRGSTGFGKGFQAAGHRQFGRKLQDDIADAAQWLVQEGLADPQSIGVMGGSFGGYAAALAMTRDIGIFRAAVVEFGMTDLKYQMENNPSAWGLYLGQVERYFGTLSNPADVEALIDHSPMTHVGNIRGSILLTAGKLDAVVGFEQSEAFERALKSNSADVTALYFEKEGHGYQRWQSNVLRARAIERFFARTLGGRQERFDIITRIASLTRDY